LLTSLGSLYRGPLSASSLSGRALFSAASLSAAPVASTSVPLRRSTPLPSSMASLPAAPSPETPHRGDSEGLVERLRLVLRHSYALMADAYLRYRLTTR